MLSARDVIHALQLEPLPGEGGFFRVTWRSETASAIYFLITRDDFSALHRLDRDEIWHHYSGHPVQHLQLEPFTGRDVVTRLGPDIPHGERPQIVVPAGTWQGARLDPAVTSPFDYALLGCVVSPPWTDECFTLGDGRALEQEFPAQAQLIRALTR
jgi:predicted cupin superfamily sugar epimerase